MSLLAQNQYTQVSLASPLTLASLAPPATAMGAYVVVVQVSGLSGSHNLLLTQTQNNAVILSSSFSNGGATESFDFLVSVAAGAAPITVTLRDTSNFPSTNATVVVSVYTAVAGTPDVQTATNVSLASPFSTVVFNPPESGMVVYNLNLTLTNLAPGAQLVFDELTNGVPFFSIPVTPSGTVVSQNICVPLAAGQPAVTVTVQDISAAPSTGVNIFSAIVTTIKSAFQRDGDNNLVLLASGQASAMNLASSVPFTTLSAPVAGSARYNVVMYWTNLTAGNTIQIMRSQQIAGGNLSSFAVANYQSPTTSLMQSLTFSLTSTDQPVTLLAQDISRVPTPNASIFWQIFQSNASNRVAAAVIGAQTAGAIICNSLFEQPEVLASPAKWPVIELQCGIGKVVHLQLTDNNGLPVCTPMGQTDFSNAAATLASYGPLIAQALGSSSSEQNPIIAMLETNSASLAGPSMQVICNSALLQAPSLSVLFQFVSRPGSTDVISVPGVPTDSSGSNFALFFTGDKLSVPGIFIGNLMIGDPAGNILYSKRFYVDIEWNTTCPPIRAIPLSVAELRVAIRDNCPADNYLLDSVEFSDREIAYAIQRPIDMWNAAPPPGFEMDATTFPYRYPWTECAIGVLLNMASLNLFRNTLPSEAAGVSLDDKGPKAKVYAAMGAQRVAEYKEWMQNAKIMLNIEGAYSYRNGYWPESWVRL